MAQRLTPAPSVTALLAIVPTIRVLPAGGVLFRIYFRGGSYPTTWDGFRSYGPTGSRFDHHPPPKRIHPTRSILYASDDGQTALAEVFQATRTIHRAADSPALASFILTRDLALLDLTSTWTTSAGGSMAIHSGSHLRARDWSRAIYSAYPNVEGLWYASSMNALQPAFALYERARSALPTATPVDEPLTNPALAGSLTRVARNLGYALT
jgi:hypothetical protein